MFGEVEGTGFEIIERRFADCFAGHARVERLWTGARWLEGPAWFAAVVDLPSPGLAEEIISTQEREISTMQDLLGG